MAILAVCALVSLNVLRLKSKNPREKISFPFIIALVIGVLIIIGFRILLRKFF
jgi:hypothetical protein